MEWDAASRRKLEARIVAGLKQKFEMSEIYKLSDIKPLPPFKPDLRAKIRRGEKTVTRRLHDHPMMQVGEVRYLREPLMRCECKGYKFDASRYIDDGEMVRATHAPELCLLGWGLTGGVLEWKWKRNSLPQIHMPKFAARTFVKITDVFREPLQDITEDDAKAEGVYWSTLDSMKADELRLLDLPLIDVERPATSWFSLTWDSINRDRKGASWDSNPTVQGYRFELIDVTINEG